MKRSKRTKKRSPSNKKRRKSNAGRFSQVSAQGLLQALERKTKELALSLSMMQATLDSTADAIVVTDMLGNVRNFNEKYCEMMGVTRQQLTKANVHKLRIKFSERFSDPEGFVSRVMEIYRRAPAGMWPSVMSDGRDSCDLREGQSSRAAFQYAGTSGLE